MLSSVTESKLKTIFDGVESTEYSELALVNALELPGFLEERNVLEVSRMLIRLLGYS
jgi:hypothetical protein